MSEQKRVENVRWQTVYLMYTRQDARQIGMPQKNSLANSSCEGINKAVDDYYAECVYQDKFAKLKENLRQIVNTKLKKDKNSLAKMSND